MSLAVKWTISFAVVPDGVQQQNVPSAQQLSANNDFGANGGYVYLPNNPTQAQVDTALNTVNTNAKAYFDNGGPLAQLQGFSTGGG